MHELFTLSEVPPVDPGTSPFRVRGVIYDRIIEHARQLPGGFATFLAEIRDERVRRFANQQFRFSGLYDCLPVTPMQIALSRAQGVDFETGTRARALDGAQRLIPRMFRVILGFSRPRAWALHAPRLVSEYCGFGDLALVHAEDTRAVFDIAAVPQFFAASHANTLIGVFQGSLEVLRARNVVSRYFDVELVAPQDEFQRLSYQLELTWQ